MGRGTPQAPGRAGQGTRRDAGSEDAVQRGTLQGTAGDSGRLGGTPRTSGVGRKDIQETGKTPFVSGEALRSPGCLGRVSRPEQPPTGGLAAHGAGSGPGTPELAGSPVPFPGAPAQRSAAKPPARPRGSAPGRDGDGPRSSPQGEGGRALGRARQSRRLPSLHPQGGRAAPGERWPDGGDLNEPQGQMRTGEQPVRSVSGEKPAPSWL